MAKDHSRDYFGKLQRSDPILCGTEAHVCELQTALGLKEHGYNPTIVADAVGSRKKHDRKTAISRMSAADISIVTAEMVLFEWLERGDQEEFRQILPMIKELPL